MALTSVASSIKFDIPSQTIIVTDNTNYAGAGLLLTQVKGVLGVTDPTSTQFYNNTDYNAPDITPSVSLVNSTTISIPEVDNVLLKGSYTVVYTVQVDNGVDPIYYVSGSATVDFNYCSPTVNITQTSDCVSPLFVSTDNTQYIVNGITPTISVQHSLYFPPWSSLYSSPIVISATATGSVISTSTFFTGPQTTIIQSTLTYVFPDNLTVTDVITGQLTNIVDCSGVCAVYCCMKALEQRWINARGVNKVKADVYAETLKMCMALMSLAKFSLECGEQQDAQGYLDEILVLGECTGDCGCGNDGTPTQVVGLTTTGESSLPWTLISTIPNDNSVIEISGAGTIDSVVSGNIKYKKVGTTAILSFGISMNITRSGTGAVRFLVKPPSSVPFSGSPFVAHGSSWIINFTASPDIETPLAGLIGVIISGEQVLKTGDVDTTTMPVATNLYTLLGTITYETTN